MRARGRLSDVAHRDTLSNNFTGGWVQLEEWLEGGDPGVNPVLDALIAFEESDDDAPFELFHVWATVDWDEWPDCAHTKRLYVREQARQDRRLAHVPERAAVVLKPKLCPGCAKEFKPRRTRHTFCTADCLKKFRWREVRACKICGAAFGRKSGNTKGGGSDYCSSACYGASKTTIFYEYGGERLGLSEWAKRTGISRKTLLSRYGDGWPAERALTTMPKQRSAA